MLRYRAIFAGLFVFAAVTSILAIWGTVGMLQPTASSASVASTTAFSSATTETSTSLSTKPSASNSVSTTTVTTTTAATTTTTVAPGATTTTVTLTSTTTQSGAANESFGASGSTSSQALYGIPNALFGQSRGEEALKQAQSLSLFLAPIAWVVLGGMWVWRGRVRSRYTQLGFGSDVFELFMKMKGGATRIKLLGTLNTPMDRLQLAEELGVDWKTVDRHVQILNKYGFVREQAAFGTTRLYEVTPMGKMLLNLFQDLERTDGPVVKRQIPEPSEDGALRS